MNNCCSLVTNETPRHSTKHILKRKCIIVVFILSVGPVEKTLWCFFLCAVWLAGRLPLGESQSDYRMGQRTSQP